MYYSIIFSLIIWERLNFLELTILGTMTGGQLLGTSSLLPHPYQYWDSSHMGHIWLLHRCRRLDAGPHACPASTLLLNHHLAQRVSLEITLSTTLLTVEKDKYWWIGLEILPRLQTKKNREGNWSENNRKLHIASLDWRSSPVFITVPLRTQWQKCLGTSNGHGCKHFLVLGNLLKKKMGNA